MKHKKNAAQAALLGLDYMIRNQVAPDPRNDALLVFDSADLGRYPLLYDLEADRVSLLSCNWVTGVVLEAMLSGYRFTGDQKYIESARLGVDSIKSLQFFSPSNPKMNGAIREWTPQTKWNHPRDAATAAAALLSWYEHSGDDDALLRARAFADWFIEVAMEREYPYWTVHFESGDRNPEWYGSFHSGSALFLYRLFELTGCEKYRIHMLSILDLYNRNHLNPDGSINVIVDGKTGAVLDGEFGLPYTTTQWETMHKYNDDFGALSNLAAYKITNDATYRNAVELFLGRMLKSQQTDGGFGQEDCSVPSAGGSVLLELLAAKSMGLEISSEEQIESVVEYLLGIQCLDKSSGAYGAFLDNKNEAHARTCAYAITALFQYCDAMRKNTASDSSDLSRACA